MPVAIQEDRIAARYSADRARKLRAEAEAAKIGTERFAAGLAEIGPAEAAMRAARGRVAELFAAWRRELPAELAAMQGQDAIHARMVEVVRAALAGLSADFAAMAREDAWQVPSRVDPLLKGGGAGYLDRLARACAPRERLTVSEWADRHRWLSSKGSGEPGRWETARNPLLREIMDCLSVHSDVRRVVIMKPSQFGVTEACINWIGYVMHHAPAPMMVMLPTIENRDSWSRQKLTTLLTDTPVIADLFDANRQRDASNSMDTKDFPGGMLFLAGGNSPNSYAQRSARYMILDDLDRFPEEVGEKGHEEGHPVALARGRTKAFPRYKLVLISTPTVREASHIEAEYQKSDMRRAHVPCPHCGEFQILSWNLLRWPEHCLETGIVTAAWYTCSHCGERIEEHHKPEMLARVRWIPEHPDRKVRGYQWSGLYASIGLGKSWLEMAQDWLDARKDPIALKTFVNTELAETWEDRSNQIKPHHLSERAGAYRAGEVPAGCLLLTAGVDTQDNRLEVHVVGHAPLPGGRVGQDFIHWTIDYLVLPGDPGREELWDRLAEALNRPYLNPHGHELHIEAAAIDEGGHHTGDVRFFAMSGRARRLMATRGMNRPSRSLMPGGPKTTEINRRGKPMRGGAKTWDVGTEVAKSYLYSRLHLDGSLSSGEQRVRFHAELEDEFYKQLLAETFDPSRNRWVLKKNHRNEALDTWCLAWYAAHHPQLAIARKSRREWDELEARLSEPLRPTRPEPARPAATPPAPPAGSGLRDAELTAEYFV